MPLRLPLLLTLLALTALSGCAPTPLTNEAYVWQRHWSPNMALLLDKAEPPITRWHVLAAESGGDRPWQWFASTPDWSALAGRAVVPVFHLQGPLVAWNDDSLAEAIKQTVSDWQKNGVTVRIVEIDHNCPAVQLDGFARFLGTLRKVLGKNIALSIVIEPDWLTGDALPAVLINVDQSVLRASASMPFDAERIRQSIDAFTAVNRTPWTLALPTRGPTDALLATGSVPEKNDLPQALAAFAASLRKHPPPRLSGISWFRFPVEGDAHDWPLATWKAVVMDEPLFGRLETTTVAHEQNLYSINIKNAGTLDIAAPLALIQAQPADCRSATETAGYRYHPRANPARLERLHTIRLGPDEAQTIAWLQCKKNAPQPTFHAQY